MRHKRQSQRVLSTYACDLFGICSALYELGGLIVMHDASGCNSTYNTHDEPRWYDIPSMVYISGLNEVDTIYGNDRRLIDNIAEVADETHPRFIAIGGSPMPNAIGTDFHAVARLTEKRTGIPTLGFRTDGIQSYVWGAGRAFLDFGKKFLPAPDAEDGGDAPQRAGADGTPRRADGPVRVNLLGATPLDFSVTGTVTQMKQLIRGSGMELCSCWAMGSSFDVLARSHTADVNAVISSTGYELARWMEETYGIPSVIGVPMGERGTRDWIGALREAGRTGRECTAGAGRQEAPRRQCTTESAGRENSGGPDGSSAVDWLLIGEPVLIRSLRDALRRERGIGDVKLLCPIRNVPRALTSGMLVTDDEEQIREECRRAAHIVADPIYARLLPGEAERFFYIPQEAFSGRYFREEIPMFAGPDALDHIRDAAAGITEEIVRAHW